ncbi:MAG: substrate-binding periplasmic protein [Candidatus Muiribacteriota bacterium]
MLIFLNPSITRSETITLATLNWEPFYGESLSEQGFFTALSREAFKRAGYNLKVEFLPWKRALEMAREGKYDGNLGAYFSNDRADTFYFTDPIAQNEEAFIQNKGRGIKFKNLEYLKQFKIGALRGGAQTAELREKGFDFEVVSDDILNIKKLHAQRVDLILMGKQQFLYLLETNKQLKNYKNSFDILEPPYKTFNLYCTITKKRSNGEKIVKKVNSSLESMKEDGTYNKILKRFGQHK